MSIEFTKCPACEEFQLDPNTLRCICCGYDRVTAIQEGMKHGVVHPPENPPEIIMCGVCQETFTRRKHLEKYPWSSNMCRECILLVVDSPTQPR